MYLSGKTITLPSQDENHGCNPEFWLKKNLMGFACSVRTRAVFTAIGGVWSLSSAPLQRDTSTTKQHNVFCQSALYSVTLTHLVCTRGGLFNYITSALGRLCWC